MIQIEIETDNAAFEDAPSCEVARILRHLAKRLQEEAPLTRDGMFRGSMALRDTNGNQVGFCSWR
jgi:hypothetical protein